MKNRVTKQLWKGGGNVLPAFKGTSDIWQKVPQPEILEFRLDETALSRSGVSVTGLEKDLAGLKDMKVQLKSEIATALETLENLRIACELGEADAKTVETAKLHFAQLQEQAARLDKNNERIIGEIEVKNGAIAELKRRRDIALKEERQRVFAAQSDEIRAELEKLLKHGEEMNNLAIGIGQMLRQLSSADLAQTYIESVPDFVSMVHIYFHRFENSLYNE